jgi:hypothetical protein
LDLIVRFDFQAPNQLIRLCVSSEMGF